MSRGPLLVVGASGFLGRTLIAACAEAKRQAVGLSRAQCDITDPAAVERALQTHRPASLVNTAAFSGVDAAEVDRAGATAANAEGPAVLGAKTAAAGIPVVHISTDYVFDGSSRRPYADNDPVTPLGHYGRSKAEGEARLGAAQPRHVILRTAWLFGRRGGGFVKMAVDAALRGEPIRALVDQTGSPTATADLANAILAVDDAIGRGAAPWGTYHYAGGEAARRIEMAEVIVEAVRALGSDPGEIVPVRLVDFAGAALRPAYSALDSHRFVATFGLPASDWRARLTALVGEEATAMADRSLT